jgi:hypothetical protein
MIKRLSLLFVLSLLVSCAELYQASVTLTIEPSAEGPVTQGGYYVQLLQTDGTPVAGTDSTFVAYAEGAQEVVLVLQDAELFAYNITGDDDESLLRLTWLAPPPSGFAYHLWSVREGVATSVQVLDENAANDVAFEFDGASLLVTAEASDEQLSTPSGWQMYASDGPSHSEAESLIIGEAITKFKDLSKLLKMANSHGGFCLDAAVGDDGAGVVNHAEHFWNMLVGNSHPFREEVDSDQSGGLPENPANDRTGVRGYLMQLRDHFDENYESLSVASVAMSSMGRLRQCAKNLEAIDAINGTNGTNDADVEADHLASAVGRALDTVPGILANHEDSDAQGALQAGIDSLMGDDFDPVRDTEITAGHTGNCLKDRVEAIGGFTFEQLDPGESVVAAP